MVLTAAKGKSAFTHVITNVFPPDIDDQSALAKSLAENGVDCIKILSAMDEEEIQALQFKDDDGTTKPVPYSQRQVLSLFNLYLEHRDSIGTSVLDSEWETLTHEEFDEFRISPVGRGYARRKKGGLRAPAHIPYSAPAPKPTPTAVDMFRRGIKRDMTLFPILKDERLHVSWHRTFTNQARAQDVINVLDENFVPDHTDPDAVALFAEQQKYMYAVLDKTVQTDEGRAIVRTYEITYDAQAAYKGLLKYHLRSTKAAIDSSQILSYITSVRLGSSAWRGSSVSFVNHWMQKTREYEQHSGEDFSDTQKRIMLENAVQPIRELHTVKTTADLQSAQGKQPLSYIEYASLLKGACVQYDNRALNHAKASKPSRSVYLHDLYDEPLQDDDFFDPGFNIDDEDYDSFDIDSPVELIQAYQTQRNFDRSRSAVNRPRVPRHVWQQLSADGRSIWDKLSDKDKAALLSATRQNSSKPGSKPDQRRGPSSSSANTSGKSLYALFHEMNQAEDQDVQENGEDTIDDDDESVPDASDDAGALLANAAMSTGKFSPGDIRRLMSQKSQDKTPKAAKKSPKDKRTTSVNVHKLTYRVSAANSHTRLRGALIDRGANGGVAGADVRVIHKLNRSTDIQGIDNHQITNVPIGTVGGVVATQAGPVIAIMHQYALYGKGDTINAPGQLEFYGHTVNDQSVRTGGTQRIITQDELYTIPLSLKSGLVRMSIRPFTDEEWDSLPHVFLTDEHTWDPTVLDYEHDLEADTWYDANESTVGESALDLFNSRGEYKYRVLAQFHDYLTRGRGGIFSSVVDYCIYHAHASSGAQVPSLEAYNFGFMDAAEVSALPDDDPPVDTALNESDVDASAESAPRAHSSPRMVQFRDPDYEKLRPLFGWLNVDTIKKTFQHTTQYGRIPMGSILKRFYKSQNPALNTPRRAEDVAGDIVYSDTPAVDNGATMAVLFTGTTTHVTDVYSIKTESQFINALEDNIRDRGAMKRFISDSAKVEISKKVQGFLRSLMISVWQSEPYRQNQNAAERRYQTVKTTANTVLDRSGAPPSTWLLCLMYVCFLLNHTFNTSTNQVPLTALTGSTPDISPLLRFHFWQRVLYKRDDTSFPSESREGIGRIVGISEHVGHTMTWKVLTEHTNKIIYRSELRPFDERDPNLRMLPTHGERDPSETSSPVIRSLFDERPAAEPPPDGVEDESSPSEEPSDPVFKPDDLIGRTFLMDHRDDGQRFRARIVELLEDHESDVEQNPTRLKFRCSVNDDEFEELISYNDLINYIEHDEETSVFWKFKRIVGHEGPLTSDHPSYNGSSYNVMMEWETGEVTSVPLRIVAADSPVVCAQYAKENNLLDTPGWKRFKRLARREKMFTRMVNQAKLRSYNTAPRFKYGFEVPRGWKRAVQLDEKNGNTKWQDAVKLEMDLMKAYSVFKDLGHVSRTRPPKGHRQIRVHLVFDVKHDGRHRARLVADGNLTDVPLESVYSGVVSLRGFRLVIFLAELNGMEAWATDVSSAYLEAYTDEKVFIIAGEEFGELHNHVLLMVKACYGLRSSGARWHERCADCLRDLGFTPSKAEPDIWMRPTKDGTRYEYVAVYVDDMALVMEDPKGFVERMTKDHGLTFKAGTEPIKYHLGMEFIRDEDGTLGISARKYIDRMTANYKRLYGEPPSRKVHSPLEKGDHPELDTSDLLDQKGISEYQSLIGSLQWAISIGRIDLATAVMTMSSFRAAPRKGHLERAKRICGYAAKMQDACIRIRTEEPDYSDIPEPVYSWAKSVYGDIKEEIPKDCPKPLGKYVTLTHYVDANLMHCLLTGRSVTGILHFLNKTPIDWFTKKQSTVETATYGSEFVAARTCVEQIIELRLTLRYLGVPIREKSYMFGDNGSVVDSSMHINAKLHKRHTMLSFHRVREAVASGMVIFTHIPGAINPADILSKHWSYSNVWTQLRCLLFWRGDTADIED